MLGFAPSGLQINPDKLLITLASPLAWVRHHCDIPLSDCTGEMRLSVTLTMDKSFASDKSGPPEIECVNGKDIGEPDSGVSTGSVPIGDPDVDCENRNALDSKVLEAKPASPRVIKLHGGEFKLMLGLAGPTEIGSEGNL